MSGTQTVEIPFQAAVARPVLMPRVGLLGGSGGFLVLVAGLFNLGLCFINTRHMLHVTNGHGLRHNRHAV